MLLEVRNLHVHYQKVAALKGVSLQVPSGGIVTIIGANGAGKSTTLRTISGLAKPSNGEIRFEGERIDNLPAEKIVARGIAHVPEGRRIFPDLTVEENLRIGAFLRKDTAKIESDIEDIFQRFPRLRERRTQWARTLSGGEQQMVAIARALITNPRLLLLDEPMEGLAPIIVQELMRVTRRLIQEEGMAVIVVEQHARLALELTERAIVLDRGRIVHQSSSRSLLDDPATLDRLVSVA